MNGDQEVAERRLSISLSLSDLPQLDDHEESLIEEVDTDAEPEGRVSEGSEMESQQKRKSSYQLGKPQRQSLLVHD